MKKVLLGILIGLLLAGAGYGVYYYFFQEKEEVKTETKEEVKTEELSLDNNLVQELYSYIDTKNYRALQTVFYGEKELVQVSDLSVQDKATFGYQAIATSEIMTDICSNYSEVFASSVYPCGTINGNENETTLVISEDTLKRSVEKIFGSGNYEHVDNLYLMVIAPTIPTHLFDEKSKSYVSTFLSGLGGTGYAYETELIKAVKNKEIIELTEKVTLEQEIADNFDVEAKDDTYKHTFVQNEDGLYNWQKVEKVK